MAKFTDVIAGLTETTDPQGDSDYIVGYDGTSVVKYLINNLPFATSTLALDELGAPSDSTSLDASTDAHGLLPKLDGTSTNFLDGTGAWSVPAGDGGGGSSSDIVLTGTDSDLPAAETEGRLYLPSNAPYVLRDTGAAWEHFGNIFKLTPPVLGDYSWVNQGGATAVSTYGGIILTAPASGSDSYRMLVKNALSTPYTVMVKVYPSFANANTDVGIAFYQSSDGKIVTWGYKGNGTNKLECNKLTNTATWSANYFSSSLAMMPLFLYMTDNGTNRIVGISDGYNLYPFHSVGRTDFLTADKIGIYSNTANASYAAIGHFTSWEES